MTKMQIVNKADMIINGYAFIQNDNLIRVINLHRLNSACVLDKNGEVEETSMDPIEQQIVLGYFEQNKVFLPEITNAEIL